MKISDIISTAHIQSWMPDIPVIISAGTGAGKSHFVKTVLADYAIESEEQILMLVNRVGIAEQFRAEIEAEGRTDVLTVSTYQSLENTALAGKGVDLSKYRYVVCDEFHYFLEDAAFNRQTDISLDRIMNAELAVKIFMSATGDETKQVIQSLYHLTEVVEYTIPVDYSFIQSLNFLYRAEDLEERLRAVIRNGEKAIVFFQKAKPAYELAQKLGEDAVFFCSNYNGNFSKKMDSEKRKRMLETERFEEKVLITTSALDTGINIKDKAVKHIFIDLKYPASIIQAIGRRRLLDGDTVSVYIRAVTNRQIGGLKSQTNRELMKADYLSKYGLEAYLQKYPRQNDESGVIYDELVEDGTRCTKKVNELMYLKKKLYVKNLDEMLSLGEYGYSKYMARKLGKYDRETGEYRYSVISGTDQTLRQYLRKIEGKEMLNVSDRKELIEKIGLKQNGRLVRGKDALNAVLREKKIPFEIQQYRDRRDIGGRKKDLRAIWCVRRI